MYLEGHYGGGLKAQIGLVVSRDFPHETLERLALDEEFRALLIFAYLTDAFGPRAPAVGLLHPTSSNKVLAL